MNLLKQLNHLFQRVNKAFYSGRRLRDKELTGVKPDRKRRPGRRVKKRHPEGCPKEYKVDNKGPDSGHGQLRIKIDTGISHLGQFVTKRSRADAQLLRGPVAPATLFLEGLDNNTELLLAQIISE